jgi:hypothetical protein
MNEFKRGNGDVYFIWFLLAADDSLKSGIG